MVFVCFLKKKKKPFRKRGVTKLFAAGLILLNWVFKIPDAIYKKVQSKARVTGELVQEQFTEMSHSPGKWGLRRQSLTPESSSSDSDGGGRKQGTVENVWNKYIKISRLQT